MGTVITFSFWLSIWYLHFEGSPVKVHSLVLAHPYHKRKTCTAAVSDYQHSWEDDVMNKSKNIDRELSSTVRFDWMIRLHPSAFPRGHVLPSQLVLYFASRDKVRAPVITWTPAFAENGTTYLHILHLLEITIPETSIPAISLRYYKNCAM